jgi:stage V sporulation protein D (sporulation-specific penicillin-binding protein)
MQEKRLFRIRIVSGIMLFLASLFVVRLYFLQIVHGDAYAKEAESQYVGTVANEFDRGSIYFTGKDNKLVAGATINSGFEVAITPSMIEQPSEVYLQLSSIIPLDKDEFMRKAARKEDPYEDVAKRVSKADREKIEALNIKGVGTYRETWRYYPGDGLASQVLGFVGFGADGKTLTGRYGLEAYHDDILTRRADDLYVNFFAEVFTNIRETIFDRTEESEADILLTIEPTVQAYLESELDSITEEWKSDQTGGIIMDPKTGAILAMASDPSFDLNNYGKEKDAGVFLNPAVQDVYEMGSTVKPLTVAAGLDSGAITANSTYTDNGFMTMNNKTFGNYDGRARGPGTTMQDVLNQSLNTGVAHIVGRMGNAKFASYMLDKFHLGEETGIDLPGERQGLVSNLSSNRDIEYATASFGQGIAVTPINITTALATLGNGGISVTPHVVREIRFTNGRIKKFTPNPPIQEISTKTSEEISRMLVNVVDKALLGGKVKIPEYSIAAKTGTAQVARPRNEGGGYYEDRYIHTFFGYFPAYDPKFIVFLYTKNPKNAEYASHTLTHPFMRTAKFLLHYYSIPPDRAPAVVVAD